ncbi:low molecular weight protein-tyrosine-phosphatase [Halomonas sp. HAL1]|uniref:low molecular weight protein-tyrosine-phosphatase n=1 Tax=Halomonas sp. HAL1 TaxID=550984 RepID=UPI00022D2A0E|nr:low molecular weight protein-tyrosine-phosphatase [Halomonas sp. HAL1]EHA14316.1 protein tyrosine phosphatase [Halomonas sp. HAL1]WKV92424.1 low molecular weight protein-tyrosine-phosphatase [Halomonas sp. HAL1]
MFHNILVVCIGNICRSPVAEAMLRAQLPDKQFSSAGLGARVGEGVDPKARQLAEAARLKVAEHSASQLTLEMLQAADLILVMSDNQRRAVAEIAPEALGKTMRLGRWLDNGKGRDIPDPYLKSQEVFEYVHRLMDEACRTWASKLG